MKEILFCRLQLPQDVQIVFCHKIGKLCQAQLVSAYKFFDILYYFLLANSKNWPLITTVTKYQISVRSKVAASYVIGQFLS